jgi:hypothetical protein
VLYRDLDGKAYDVELPLTSNVDPAELREQIHCPSANSEGPLARAIKDTDFIVPKKQGVEFYKLLLNMDKAFGTHFKSFATANDRRFNAWRHGERYRVTTINGVTEDGLPTITVLDLFCDYIDLRHKVEVNRRV